MKHFSKAFLYVFFILVLFSCNRNLCEEKQNSRASKEVLTVLENQFDAWNKGNLAMFMEGYEKSDSIQFITQNGRIWGWQNVFNKYKKHYSDKQKMGKLSFEDMNVRFISHNIAQVYGKWQVKTDTVFGGVFSVFLRKKNKDWRIFIDHTW